MMYRKIFVICIFSFLFAASYCYSAQWSNISGTVSYGNTPVCGLILANGQFMFSCGQNQGVFNMTVPLDGNGEITLFSFVSGMAPFEKVLTPTQASNYSIYMQRAGDCDQTPYNQAQTERLIGKWYFTYTIISQFNGTYTLPGPAVESTSTPGVYNLFGYDTYMNKDVVAGYSPSLDSFSLLDISNIIDKFFVFDFVGSNTVSGCYYQVDKNSGDFSDCYPMKSTRIGTASLMNSLENMDALTSIDPEEKESQLIEEVRAHNLAKSSLEKTATVPEDTERRVHVLEEIEKLRQELEGSQ